MQVPQEQGTVCIWLIHYNIPFAYQVVSGTPYTFAEGMHFQLPAKGVWEWGCVGVTGKFLSKNKDFPQTAETVTN